MSLLAGERSSETSVPPGIRYREPVVILCGFTAEEVERLMRAAGVRPSKDVTVQDLPWAAQRRIRRKAKGSYTPRPPGYPRGRRGR